MPSLPDPSLKPVMLITGATRGIGREIARLAASGGHDLWLIARHQNTLDALKIELLKTHNINVWVQAVDLTDIDCGNVITEQIASNSLYVRYLINSAGLGVSGPFATNDHKSLMQLIDLNIRALSDLSHRFLPDMLARRSGGILNVASVGGFLPGPYQAAYYASKAYVISLSRALAYENWGRGVKIAVLMPGPVTTGFHQNMGSDRAYYLKLLPVMSSRSVARTGLSLFLCGRRLIVPGYTNFILALAANYLPGIITIPFIGWLLKNR